jgi:hypothetical protein
MKKGFFLGLIVLLAISCSDSNSVPRGILSREKMQNVLWDMIDAGEFLDTYVLNKDSIDKVAQSSKVYGQVFQVNHITREEFDKSYSYYRNHPALMKTILDSLSKRQPLTGPSVVQKPDSLNKQQSKTAPVTGPIQRPDSLRKKRKFLREK